MILLFPPWRRWARELSVRWFFAFAAAFLRMVDASPATLATYRKTEAAQMTWYKPADGRPALISYQEYFPNTRCLLLWVTSEEGTPHGLILDRDGVRIQLGGD